MPPDLMRGLSHAGFGINRDFETEKPGAVGAAWMVAGKPKVAIGFSLTGGRISEIDMVMEPEDIRALSFELIGE